MAKTQIEGNVDVVRCLRESASLHLTAIETYTGQAAHLERWGYPKLAEKMEAEAADERGHLNGLLALLERYDEPPDWSHDVPDWPRHDFVGLLTANLAMERAAADVEEQGVRAACEALDEDVARVFRENLRASRQSIDEITATLLVIDDVSVQNYLANQT